ncbi:MAG: hypothetical protein Q9221_006326 [Calogaya cf. arnoldii]
MAGQAIDRLTPLPPELKIMIVEFATSDPQNPRYSREQAPKTQREALGKIRRTIRPWKDAASTLLFREITFPARMTAPEWSANPFTYGPCVETLNVVTIEYLPLGFQGYLLQTDEYLNGPYAPDSITDRAHEEQGFDIYCELEEEHLETLKKDVCPAHLRRLLRSMSKLRKVVLTGDQRALHNYCDDYEVCLLSTCTELVTSHGCHAVAPRAGVYDLGRKYLKMLMKALSTAKKPIQELIVEGGEPGRALNCHALNMPHSHIQYTANVFSRHTTLELEIFADSTKVEDLKGFTGGSSPIAQVLSYATKLEHFRLTTEGDYGDDERLCDFKTVMLGCVFPKLKTCVIGCWIIETTDLLSFLRGSPDLRQLRLYENQYKVGSLDDVLKVLRHENPGLTVEV